MSELVRTTAKELTSTEVSRAPDIDMLFRITSDFTSESIQVRYAKTGDVQAYLDEKHREIVSLVGVVHWQHSLLDYNSYYNAFLLGQLNDDEFSEISERFAYEPSEVKPDLIAPTIEKIYKLTSISYTPSELAGLLKCKQENAMDALRLLKNKCPEVRNMLPSEIE